LFAFVTAAGLRNQKRENDFDGCPLHALSSPARFRAGRSNFLDALAFFCQFLRGATQGGQRPGRQQPPPPDASHGSL